MIRRRDFLTSSAVLAGASLVPRFAVAQASAAPRSPPIAGAPSFTPVVTPNGSSLPWTMNGGVKEFRLVAEPVKREFAPGMVVNCWGYNGSVPGPTIEAVEGDRVRLFITNKLPERTSVHWHGILLPSGMDGVAGLSQPHVLPGETYVYEFTLKQHGTFMYHPHSDEMTQMAMGMSGFFVIHPRAPAVRVDRHFVVMLHEWYVEPGTATPNPNVMLDFNLFTFNGRVFPGTDSWVVRTGQRVRFSFGNLSMDSHPIHVHGYEFSEIGTDAGPLPPSARRVDNTINVAVGSTRTVELIANAPGDWAFHCHKSHHTMNAMSHDVPNMIGVAQGGSVEDRVRKHLPRYMAMGETGMGGMMDMGRPKNTLPMMAGEGPFGPIEMGGMFTVLKVRDGIKSYEDPGWYVHPPGTVARKVAP